MTTPINIFWFRRDLRLHDNAGLYHALKGNHPVLPVFIFDRDILDQLDDKRDSRVQFIHDSLSRLQALLKALGSSLEVIYGKPVDIFAQLLQKYTIANVFTNHDYEPYATDRDDRVSKLLQASGVAFHTFKDQVIFEKNEILKEDGRPYVVFTPYSKRWLDKLDDYYLRSYPCERYQTNFHKVAPIQMPSLSAIGFAKGGIAFPHHEPAEELIRNYKMQRDYPATDSTSRMGVHLRFGTASIRELVRSVRQLSEVYLKELIWREFYQMILWHFPKVGKGRAFRSEYENIEWRNNENEFLQWCRGATGYPLVDAGMRQLNSTGFMHNRVRMVVASFLSKHLLIDWRWGESYFAQKLLDYELASNNGGWQWAAGSGCDAAPYFRVFNPTLQMRKFDPELQYVRKWVPEFEDFGYPRPMVHHEFARKRCLEAYSKALKI